MGPRRWPLLWGLRAVLVQVAVLTAGQRPQERPPGWSPAPSSPWAPTAEPAAPADGEGSAAALAFLRTGDAERLARANCSGGVAAGAAGPGPPPALRAALRAAPEALAHAANFLNMLFQTNDIREASVAEDVEWYQALVRSLAEGHPWVRRAVLALDAHPLAPKPRLMLQATKGDGQILLQDVSGAAPSLGNLSWDNEWFNALKSQRVPALRKRVLSNDLRSLETPKWQRGDSYVGDAGHVRWSPPFLECREGRFLPAWAVTLSSAFYGLKPDLSPEFKGVVRVDVELRDVAIDQCSSGPGWFSDTHRCDLNSTQCVPQESRGFVLGRYLCRCKPGFYGTDGVASGAWAGVAGTDGGSRLGCRPCRPGCATCEDDTPCLIQEDQVLRAAVLSCQACCMLAIFLSMLVSYHFRRSKRIRTSGIILLETILFGSLLLYFPVFILYFKPSIFRCIVLRWVRMLGFAIVYGTITLKLYRVLKVFLSRSAQRAPYVSSGRVLRMLAPILLLVLWFLAAWTIGMLENARKNIPLVIRAQTSRGLHFSICGHDCWDYMMVIAEMLFLLWGSFLCYATRAVPSAFHEPRYMGIALHNELMVSATFHVVRFLIVPSLHPDWTLLLFFAHTHGTITMTLALLFIPKFLHTGSPLREEITAEVYEDELDMRRSGSCMNSSIASAWSEHSLDPDDIREELKKLYRQLEVHKTWRMATNNPHLAKKRSSRRSLARSILRRSGAELAESASRRSSAGERPGTPSRRGSSAKRLVDAAGPGPRMRDESSRRRSSALRKSRSSEGPPREPRRGSRTPSPPQEPPPAAVTDLEQSDSDSLDAAPLLCKSASAQNLAGPWQRPPGRAPPLQKSHSAVTGARDAALLAARRATREQWHGGRHLSAPAPGVASGTATPPSPAERGPHEGDAKGHKHVTYAPIKSVSVDSAHPGRKVRVTVKKTPPAPPVRYQSLQRSGTLGDCAEPPPVPPVQAGEAQGTGGDDPERASPPAGKGRLPAPSASSAHVCPWELVQDEILGRKQRAAEAAESGSPGDTAAATPGPKPAPTKSFRSLGLAIKALNRSRGKSILKGKSEGSLRKRGSSRRERSGPAEASAASLGGVSPEGSGQSLEVPALQHNNNAATGGEGAGWGDSGTGGERDRLAAGTGHGDSAAEQPSAARGDAGTALEPPSAGHQGAERAPEVARVQPRERDQAPAVDLRGDVPAVTAEEGTMEEPEGTSRSSQPREHPEEEQPPAKPTPSSVRGARPPGGLGTPAGRGALLRQAAIAPREDGGSPESPEKALEERSSQPEPERGPGRSWSGAGSAQRELGAGGTRGDPSPKAGTCPGKGRSEGDSQRSPGMEKPPGLPKEAPEQAEGRRAEVCPWESREQGRSVGAEICPWDTEGAPPEQGAPRSGEGVEQPPALPKPSPQQAGTMQSKKANICPWEVEDEPRPKPEICPWEEAAAPSGEERLGQDTRGAPKGEEKVGSRAPEKGKQPPAKALPKSPSGRPQSSEKAEICPWESQGSKSSDKAEICPWEVAEPQLEKGTAPGKGKLPGKETSEVLEKGSRDRESICPWESPDTEQPQAKPHTGSSALPKAAPGKSQSSETAEICPWESQDIESSSKAEICPWEVADQPSGKEKPRQDKEDPSRVSKSPSTSQGRLKEVGASFTSGKDRESICPWESQGSKSSDKAEICPWEVAEPQLEKGTVSGKEGLPRREETKALEKGSRDRESICPWESPDTEQPQAKPQTGSSALPKPPAGKSQSSEKAEICPWESQDTESSSKAEICPWESQDTESSSKAEICPWEAAEPPSQQPKAKQVPAGGPKGDKRFTRQAALASPERSLDSRDRASVCPWESPDTGQPLVKPQSSALPRAAPGKSQSSEKAEICPWESESSDKAEICPWEVAEPQLEKGTGQSKGKLPGKETSKALEKGSRERESICPWESLDTEQPQAKPHTESSALPKAAPGKSQSSEKAEICPWESQDIKSSDKGEICPWEVAEPQLEKGTVPGKEKLPRKGETKALEKGSRERESICPWESQGSKSSDKAEICPWEVAEPQLEKGTAPGKGKLPGKETSEVLEKGSRDRESICPWESPDTEQPQAKPHTGSSALPKAAPGKSQSSEKAEICPWESQDIESSSKAEICPWESQDIESSSKAEICPWDVAEPQLEKGPGPGKGKLPGKETKALEKGSRERESICPWESQDSKSSDKAEICPWEVAKPQEKGTGPGKKLPPREASKAVEKSSRDQESICPWESPDTEELCLKSAVGKEPSKKSDSTESRKSEICPWEAAEPLGLEEAISQSGAQPQAAQRGSPAGTGQPGAGAVSPALLERSRGRCQGEAEHKPLCRLLPSTQRPGAGSSPSPGAGLAEVCPWEAPAAPAKPSLGVGKSSEVCPWEEESTEPPRARDGGGL
ncbi:putative G-protein coupled receptor 179 isoform X4 [Zonotrichia albicollis]|uniref:putative G-protein coupled receptor 179 isoform X4 n=1 Tax=Zonotrichia albicollis TaxID=44394 RepID=UPI003D80F656